ncbi:hypothetical protein QBC37DRAFT_431456, partial [Rhypophila decipiens]
LRQVFTVFSLFLPPVKFEVDDVESPRIYPTKLALILCRYMAACILDWPKLASPQTTQFAKRFGFPLGPWPKDPAFKNIGLYNITQPEDGVEGFSLALLVGLLGWSSK